jgi:hypothetical protein
MRHKSKIIIAAVIVLLFLVSCKKSQSMEIPYDKITPEFCEILGMLDEYMSRFDYVSGEPWQDVVERFYPKEINLARHFAELIHIFEKQISFNFNVEKETISEGHIFFRSESLSSMIKFYYVSINKRLATLNTDFILEKPEEYRMAYLKGAYARYGSGNRIRMANAPMKILTLSAVLESLGADEVAVYASPRDYIPSIYVVVFSASEAMQKHLNMSDSGSPIDLGIDLDIFTRIP